MGEYEDMAGFPYVMLPNLREMQMRHTHKRDDFSVFHGTSFFQGSGRALNL